MLGRARAHSEPRGYLLGLLSTAETPGAMPGVSFRKGMSFVEIPLPSARLRGEVLLRRSTTTSCTRLAPGLSYRNRA
jgi:hypothetical protein